jgi:GH3 auxin-responsive promoter
MPETVLQRLAGRPLVRRAADAVLTRQARRRVAALDRCSLARVQRDTLLRLVRRAVHTRFGRLHDFAGIRSIADYQRRVPLRGYEAFWDEFWKPVFPYLDGETWPGLIPYFALSSGTTSGSTKYIPVSREMLASNRKAALTTLAFYQALDPDLGLFRGQMFFLGGSTDLQDLGKTAGHVLGGDLSGIAALEVPSVLRPYTFPSLDLALERDWEKKMQLLAEQSATLPITLVSGVPSWMLVLFDRLRAITGKEHLSEIWPELRMVIHGGTRFDPYRDLFRRLVGSDQVHFAEVYPASEGFVATEDPRYRMLRLIPDHHIFFEFVPVDDMGQDRPARHTVADLEPGVQYAVVLTTCAGLWSYILGDTVTFERRDPPLLRFTGRTKYFLSAFGEHLISEEVERGVTAAAEATGATAIEFHVGPLFPETPTAPGRHLYLVEFETQPTDLARFADELDQALCRINEDYEAHRRGDLTMLAPEVRVVQRGGFAGWMRSKGKLGGQHKVPRMDNSGEITRELSAWLETGGFLERPAGPCPPEKS